MRKPRKRLRNDFVDFVVLMDLLVDLDGDRLT